jgi:TolA-binding protein
MLMLNQGRLLAKVSKRAPGQSFIVVTPNAVCEVVGTRFEVSVAPHAGILTTSLSVLKGRVNLSSRYHKSVRKAVAAGRSAALSGEDMFFAREGESDVQKLEMDMADLSLPVESAGDAARPMGTLSITSDPPGAYTFINGRAVGQTPLVLEKPSDTYQIALALPGYAVYEQSLRVGRNKGAETHASLEKIKYLKFLKSIMIAREGLREPVPQEKAPAPVPQVIPAVPIVQAAGGSPLAQSLFADAVSKLESGDFGGALNAFEYLKSTESDNIEAKLQVMDKIARCYRALNNFSACVQVLDEMYRISKNHVKKDNLLWEIADIRASRLGQYEAAEKDLLLYVKECPGGFWIHEAYIKLAEIQYLLKKAKAAAATYTAYIEKYPQNRSIDKAYYNLAYILGHDLNDCGRAVVWYRKLLAGHPQSPFVEDAVFWKADCLARLNKKEEAKAEYLNYLARFPNGRWKDATREKLADLAPQTAR